MKRVALACGSLLLLFLSGCSAHKLVSQPLLRGVREVTGQQSDFHIIVPIRGSRGGYSRLAVNGLDNLMGDAVPAERLKYLNDALVARISRQAAFREVVQTQEEAQPLSRSSSTLVLDGFLDDYDEGARGLRGPELGLNHAVVTVRIQLYDAQTRELVGSASITVYERGVTRTATSAWNRAVDLAAGFIAQAAAPKAFARNQAAP